MSNDWSVDEVKYIIEDYFSMLKLELEGQEYSKTSHANTLMTLLNNRSRQSVEFIHANISASLSDRGYRYINGYKPRGNYQKLISKMIDDYLASHKELDASLKINDYKTANGYVELKYALRDEKINIFAMTIGGLSNKFKHQIVLCKKTPFREGKV